MLRALTVVPVTAILASILVLGISDAALGADCSPQMQQTDGCPSVSAGIDDDAAILTGNTVGGGGGGGQSGASDSAPSDPPADCVVNDPCFRDTFTVTMLAVTLADIAAFRPVPGVDSMEPNGWMVVGLNTNFFSTGGSQIVDGTLLGQPASVRFTPVGWHWTYGDGTSRSSRVSGGPWAGQGIREFDATPTSHSYRAAGTYYIDLRIDYRAEYRFGNTAWAPITGRIILPTNRLVATAGDAKTVLVERECTANPAGPGC